MKLIAIIFSIVFYSAFALSSTRPEATEQVQLITTDECLISPGEIIASQYNAPKNETLNPLIVPIVASIASDLVKFGANQLGGAIERASQEKGYVAEAKTYFNWFKLSRPTPIEGPLQLFSLKPKTTCLTIYKKGNTRIRDGNLDSIVKNLKISTLNSPSFNDDIEQIQAAFDNHHLTNTPSLFVELLIVHLDEGYIVRPVLVWYASSLKGAPTSYAKAELHIHFGIPGTGDKAIDIGQEFSFIRLNLPKVKPGNVYSWNDLESYTSVVFPNRTSDGYASNKLKQLNDTIAQHKTKEIEIRDLERVFNAATLHHTRKPTTEAEIAMTAAKNKLADTTADKEILAALIDTFPISQEVGLTNTKMRFVVIKDENKFGLAVATALKSQSDAIGTAAKTAIEKATSPEDIKPAWSAAQSAYVSAESNVNLKEKEYNDAVAKNDATAIARADGELRSAKAKLNEAAVTLGKPIPYPSLIL